MESATPQQKGNSRPHFTEKETELGDQLSQCAWVWDASWDARLSKLKSEKSQAHWDECAWTLKHTDTK